MRRRILIAIVLLPATLVGILLVYLTLGDLSWIGSRIERAASAALGRRLTIHGAFDVQLARTTTLVGEDVELADAPWSPGPAMIRVERLEVAIDTWSLLSGPLRLRRIEAQGARIRLERDEDGRHNWLLDLNDGPGEPAGDGPALLIDELHLADFSATYRDAASGRRLELLLTRVDAAAQENGDGPPGEAMVELDLEGRLDDVPVELRGRFGPWANLLGARGLRHDLEGRIGSTAFVVEGWIDELATLGGVDLSLRIEGPDPGSIPALLGLGPMPDGPFRIEATVRPDGSGNAVEAEAVLQELTARIEGRVGDLLDPREVTLDVSVSGRDPGRFATLFGLDGLPGGEVELTGRVSREGARFEFEGVEIQLDAHALTLDATLGPPPEWLGTEVSFDARGPDLSAFATLLPEELPPELLGAPYAGRGRLARVEGGVELSPVDVRLGDTRARIDGRIGDLPELAGTRIEFVASGPELSMMTWPGVELPTAPFEIAARLTSDGGGVRIESLSARLGANSIAAEGIVGTSPGLAGTDLQIDLAGDDLAAAVSLVPIDLPDLPGGAYRVSGGLRVERDEIALDAVEAFAAGAAWRLAGQLGPPPGFEGTRLDIELHSDDSKELAVAFGLSGLPATPLRISGRLGVEPGVYVVEELRAEVDAIEIELAGRIVSAPGHDGSAGRASIRGPDARRLAPYLQPFVEVPELPGDRFEVQGRLRIEGSSYLLDEVGGEVGQHRFRVDGRLTGFPWLVGSDLELELAGGSAADLGRIASTMGLGELPGRVSSPYTLSGRLQGGETTFGLDGVILRIGDSELSVSGTLGRPPSWADTDLSFEGEGPDASIAVALSGAEIPEGPAQFGGRIVRTESAFRFHDVRATLPGLRASVDGVVGVWPNLEGTDAAVHAEGPSLEWAARLFGQTGLPDESFSLDGHFEGTTTRFELDEFRARLGESDLRGSLRIDLTEKPRIEGVFSADRLDLRPWIADVEPEAESTPAVAAETEATPTADRPRMVLPDEPLPFDRLDLVDGEITLTAGELVTPLALLNDLRLTAHLSDRTLRVQPISVTPALGGTFEGSLTLEPADRGYRALVDLRARQMRFRGFGPREDPTAGPPMDLQLRLSGSGNSLHELLASGDGEVLMVHGAGTLDATVLDALSADVLVQVLDALNPFRKDSDTTELECIVLLGDLREGVVRFDPLALRSNRSTIIGHGKIDFSTEKLDLSWVTKPRKGVGLSASTVTNPYVKLGGQMSDPNIEIKPLEAVTATGAAVVTVGLSFLAKGMWDRVTAERKVCRHALDEVRRWAEQHGVELEIEPDP